MYHWDKEQNTGFFLYIDGKMYQKKLIYMLNNKISNLMSNIEELEQQNLELKYQIMIRTSKIWELKKDRNVHKPCKSIYKCIN